MVKLNVNTYAAWAEKLREIHGLPSCMSDSQTMSWVYHSYLKQPPENIGLVKRSSLLDGYGPHVQQALDELERDALRGNLKKYITKEAKKLGGKHDSLLYRSAIWHFHILPESGKAIHTSSFLVYAYMWRNILYLLEVRTHKRGEFRRDRYYLEIINKEWPEVLPMEDIEVEYPPLGGGVELTQESTLIVGYYENMKRFADHADSLLKKTAEELKLMLLKKGGLVPDSLDLEFFDYDRLHKKGFNPSYAFFYQISGTPFFILCDLRNGENKIHFLTAEECGIELKKIQKEQSRPANKNNV